MEGRRLIFDHSTIESRRQRLAYRLSTYLAEKGKDVVLCIILKGAAYFGVDLSRDLQDLDTPHSMYFLSAVSYKGTQQQDSVSVQSSLAPSKFKDKHVVLVDELFDNGKTMDTVRTHLIKDVGVAETDITTCVMFRKRDKETDHRQPDFVGTDVPNVWLVGYGLDDEGYDRGVRHLYGMTPGRDWTPDDWRLFVCGTINKE